MVGIDMLQEFLFPLSPSVLLNITSLISFLFLSYVAFSELRGTNLQYSKFVNSSSSSSKKTTKPQIILSSKIGMFVIYTPAFLFGVASFVYFPNGGIRFFLLSLALNIHFFKRIFEVLFIHKYGDGGAALDSTILISLSYFLSNALMIYGQHLSNELTEPSVDLKYAGVGLFLLGIGGNFYHHYILSNLRRGNDDKKEYKIPKGGLFNRVICPHYLFELLGFVGVCCIGQTYYCVSYTAGTTLYLMARSYMTRKWYLSKFEDFPKDVKALIPFIF